MHPQFVRCAFMWKSGQCFGDRMHIVLRVFKTTMKYHCRYKESWWIHVRNLDSQFQFSSPSTYLDVSD